MDTTIVSATTCSAATTYTTSPSKYGSLHTRQATVRPSRRNLPVNTTNTKAREFESVEIHDIKRVAPVTMTRRSVSCFELGSAERRYRTIRIGEGSEELQRLAQANVTQLKQTASSSVEADANNALLALKALRYRKINCTSLSC